MTDITAYHQSLGATVADDGIPLHYGDLEQEYQTALNASIVLDRSHEGRIILTGKDRFELVNRISTNKIVNIPLNEGRPTIFTNATARILYRVTAYNRPEGLLIITEPGQGDALAGYLQRNIFYGDEVQLINLQQHTHQFAIHGVKAHEVIHQISPQLAPSDSITSAEVSWQNITFTMVKQKPLVGDHWVLICQKRDAVTLHQHLMELDSLHPAGSLTYNVLRIRSGRPAGIELSQDYIPLEVGLWDEVSFDKGCYTGQEIIARMDSRQRLAKTIVKLRLSSFISAPAIVYAQGKSVGKLTSSVVAPDGTVFGLGIIKPDHTQPNTSLTIGDDGIMATVSEYAGQQPTFIETL